MASPVLLLRGAGSVGVVLVHDITGLDAFNRSMAERLHREGFWVAAVDLFGGKTAPNLEEGMKLRAGLTKEHMVAALRAGFDRLRAEMGPAAVIGAMGFCMGGGAALQGACAVPFAFCVDYYGRIESAADVAGLHGPLLLILGSEDDRLNPWAYGELLPKLDEHKKRVRVELYPGVAHAFHREGWPPYHAASAKDAWGRAVAFIRAHGQG
jgi:carboxymethylenebutenolidase